MIRIDSEEESSLSLGPDLTPLLDVVFIVLVFLLFTANSQTLSLPVNLPQATQQEASVTSEPKTLTISIFEEGEPWAIAETKYDDWNMFTTQVLEQVTNEPDIVVLIAGDQEAPLGNLVKLMMFLSKHEIEAAQVLMEESSYTNRAF